MANSIKVAHTLFLPSIMEIAKTRQTHSEGNSFFSSHGKILFLCFYVFVFGIYSLLLGLVKREEPRLLLVALILTVKFLNYSW